MAVEPAVARTEGENGGANYFSVIAVAPTLVADSATRGRAECRRTRETRERVACTLRSPPSRHTLSMCHLLHSSSTPLVKVFLAMLGHTTRHSIFLVSNAPYFLLNRSISTLRTCSMLDRSPCSTMNARSEYQMRVPMSQRVM